MERKYKDFLTNKNLVESRIIYDLSKTNGYGVTDLIKFFVNKNNNINTFIEHYEKNMCSFEQEVTNFDIERVMENASVDCSYELLQNSNYADVGEEQIDRLIDASESLLIKGEEYDASLEKVDAKLIKM